MADVDVLEAAEAPVTPYDGDYPGTRLRRAVLFVVAVLAAAAVAVGAWQLDGLHSQIHRLDGTVRTQDRQIQQLQQKVSSLDSSLNAAVGCLQTSAAHEGLCSRFVH